MCTCTYTPAQTGERIVDDLCSPAPRRDAFRMKDTSINRAALMSHVGKPLSVRVGHQRKYHGKAMNIIQCDAHQSCLIEEKPFVGWVRLRRPAAE